MEEEGRQGRVGSVLSFFCIDKKFDRHFLKAEWETKTVI